MGENSWIPALIGLLLGFALGGAAIFYAAKGRREDLQARLETSESARQAETERLSAAQASLRALSEEKGRMEGTLSQIDSLRSELSEARAELDRRAEEVATLGADLAQALSEAQGAERSKLEALAAKDEAVRAQIDQAERASAALLEQKEKDFAERKRILDDAERLLAEKFDAASVRALKTASEEFLKLANQNFEKSNEQAKGELSRRQQAIDELLKPVRETLDKMDKQTREVEEKRAASFGLLEKQIQTLASETDQLANALRKPAVRGTWGEFQLQLLLENAGLIEGAGFTKQDVSRTEDGMLRTDFVIKLPGGRRIVIDSKAPLNAFADAQNAQDESERLRLYSEHAKAVAKHAKELAKKDYWKQTEGSPDFVVMFLPTEGAFTQAVSVDATIVSNAMADRVYITNPATLMTVLNAVAFVLNEERLRQNAEEIRKVGAELVERLSNFVDHLGKAGRSLEQATKHYDSAVGSLDSRLLPAARRMQELGVRQDLEIDALDPLNWQARASNFPVLAQPAPSLGLPLPQSDQNHAEPPAT
jgi:DNA recombination protein RmuC